MCSWHRVTLFRDPKGQNLMVVHRVNTLWCGINVLRDLFGVFEVKEKKLQPDFLFLSTLYGQKNFFGIQILLRNQVGDRVFLFFIDYGLETSIKKVVGYPIWLL